MKDKTILVIDDEQDLRDLVKDNLELEDYTVVTATNGVEGLEVLKKTTPDLIVLDMNMPKMNGIEFFNEITKSSKDGIPPCPVLILTARANLEDIFRDLAVSGFMTKPFEVTELVDEVNLILSGKSANHGESREPDKPLDVMVIEDDPIAGRKIKEEFESKGKTVRLVYRGAQGIADSKANRPDVIIIKMSLCDISGDTVASRLKQMPKTSDIPVILYTDSFEGSDRSVLLNICRNTGVKAFVESNDPAALHMEVVKIFVSC